MSTSNQAQTSKEKGIIQNIGFKEFVAICDEYRIVETATKELLNIANDPMGNERIKVDIYKWIIEMNIGKPKQMNDITLENSDKPQGITISYTTTKNDLDALENLKSELLQMGCTEEQIQKRLDEKKLTKEEAGRIYDEEEI